MEITISAGTESNAIVRTSTGICQECESEEQAIVFARGLLVGWEAARMSIPVCRGFQNDISHRSMDANEHPSYGFIVLFMPYGEETVNHMRVVGAWSSSSPSLDHAKATMEREIAEDRYGHYSACGRGTFTVARQYEG